MHFIVFDLETKNIFRDVGKMDPKLLDISVLGAYDSATGKYSAYFENELPKLWPVLEKADALVGYNSDHFDIPILDKYYPGDLKKIKSIDLMKDIKQACGKRLGLNAIASATLGVKKSGHGLDAYRWWREGKYEQVRDYCLDDVKITKELFDHMRKHKVVKYDDFGTLREVQLNIDHWEDGNGGAAITHTLPF